MGTREGRSEEPVFGLMLRTRLGWIAAAARGERLIRMTLPCEGARAAERELGIEANYKKMQPVLWALCNDLRQYFAGERTDFGRYRVDLDEQPPFLRRALMAARTIPYGEVRTYGWLARMAGNPQAARAAGQAMARNPLPITIPCHRVIAADGGLGGFGGGLEMKRALLGLEGVVLT